MIALVISIIVMLILAGVSISAIVGENGLLTQIQYATFLNDMAAVEEAVQMWKAGEVIDNKGTESNLIPTNGICKVNDVTSTERLAGEIGYYRVWSTSEIMPTTNILSSAVDFNGKFETELLYNPTGVQDLYYLNNEEIGIKDDKAYVIDAITGIVYSMTGIGLKGVRCYSSSMAKSVMSGNTFTPVFAEAEVSGTVTGEKLAGNTGTKYIEDEDGNLIENPDYNPNGFRIIADSSNENIYKLYNNGNLYAKGKKGLLLNSSNEEIENISSTKWLSNNIPTEIPGSTEDNVEMIVGNDVIYIIDKNKDVWAWGKNNYNKFGLSNNDQIEYSRYSYIKLNIGGKKVKRIIPLYWATFVITETNELYASGYNAEGNLGIGSAMSQTDKFEKVEFPEADKIKSITDEGTNYAGENGWNFILTTTGNLYFAGERNSQNDFLVLEEDNANQADYVTKWTKVIFDENATNIPDFKKCVMYRHGTWGAEVVSFFDGDSIYFWENGTFTKQEIFDGYTDCQYYYALAVGSIFIGQKDGEYHLWFYSFSKEDMTFGYRLGKTGWIDMTEEITFPFEISNIEKICIGRHHNKKQYVYYFLNNGKVYASGYNSCIGITDAECLEITEITELEKEKNNILCYPNSGTENIFLLSGGKVFGIDQIDLVLRDSILEKNWVLILSDVKDFKATTSGNEIAYIDLNENLKVRAINSRVCGYAFNSSNINDFTDISNLDIGTEVLEDDIASGVKDYFFSRNYFYILFNNGEFYTGGAFNDTVWPYKYYHGLAEENEDDFYGLKKVFADKKVNIFRISALNGICQTTDGKVYGWGNNNGYALWDGHIQELEEYEEIGNILMFSMTDAGVDCFAVGESGVVSGGLERSDGYTTGLGKTVVIGEKWTNLTEEEFIKTTYTDSKAFFLLSTSGNVYGCGNGNLLGINDYTKASHGVVEKVYSNGDASDIVSGKGWTIIVTKDGQVYGTGSNELGILGRWKGAPRTSGRYRTAFTWVECPELEI